MFGSAAGVGERARRWCGRAGAGARRRTCRRRLERIVHRRGCPAARSLAPPPGAI